MQRITTIFHNKFYKKAFASTDTNMVVVAIVLGIIAGLFGVVFRWVLDTLTLFNFGGNSLNFVGNLHTFDGWYIVLVPTIGGLIVGTIKYIFAPNILQGMGEVIALAVRKKHTMTPQKTMWSFIINITTLGTGGSAGSLGPIVHLVGGLCAYGIDICKIPRQHSRTLLGCVVAAAVGSSLNAPMAGMFFAAELIVGSYAISYVLPIVVASVSGTLIANFIYGEYSGFSLEGLSGVGFMEVPLFVILGVLCAFVARAFILGLDHIDTLRIKLHIPLFVSPAVGGFGVGLIALEFPQVMGTGYFATDVTLAGSLTLFALGSLLCAKFLAAMLTLGFGGGGGISFPALFIGALFGGFFGSVLIAITGYFGGDLGHAYTAYSMAGMGAVFATIIGAPVSAIFLIFELSHNYSLSLSVMISTLVAARVLQSLKTKSVFVHKLEMQGLNLSGSTDNIYARDITARDLMWLDFCQVTDTDSIQTVRETLITSPLGRVFVVDADTVLLGEISLYSMGNIAFDKDNDHTITVYDVMNKAPPFVREDTDLDTILPLYQMHKDTVFVVVDTDHKMLGILHENDVLIAYKKIVYNSREQERI